VRTPAHLLDSRKTMYNLLSEPLIGIRTVSGTERVALPELLALLSAGNVEDYTGLRAHQAGPWHVFLVQLAASIQARFPTDTLPTDPTYWRNGLLDLADGEESAWHLLVEDVTKPAFMQHPWKSWEKEAKDYGVECKRGEVSYEPKATTPDELDVLITAKNHDLKIARIHPNLSEAWLYAIVVFQTTSGVLGRDNYGVIRMNSGTGSRTIVAWASSLNPSRRFTEEVAILAKMRQRVLEMYGFKNRAVVLTWLSHWDRDGHQYLIKDLEPWFVETARALRLQPFERGLIALGATSKVRQIGPKSLENGDVGDPWMPLNTHDKKKGISALTLSKEGWTPQLLTNLLFQKGYRLTPLQEPRPVEGVAWFVASCLARGQGKTEGFHRVEIPVPPKVQTNLRDKPTRDTLGHLAQDLLTDAEFVQRFLATALAILTEGGPKKLDFERIKAWLGKARSDFARRWEGLFFPTLWRGAEEAHETVRADWQQALVDAAQAILDEARERMPLPANRTWRAITQAQQAFIGLLRKHDLPCPGRATVESPEMKETAL